jgi:formate hydrogenlyase transcriptional activator
MVLQSQEPLIVSEEQEQSARWPRHGEQVTALGVRSACYMTTARRRLGVLAFGSKQPGAYDTADVDFLRQVANQVAVAGENGLAFQEIAAAFQEIQALKDKLAKENAYLEEEVRT